MTTSRSRSTRSSRRRGQRSTANFLPLLTAPHTRARRLSPETVKNALRIMVSGKYKVLIKTPATGYAQDHAISANMKFTDQQRRIKCAHAEHSTPGAPLVAHRRGGCRRIPTTVAKASQEERKHSTDAVDEVPARPTRAVL
jgi:hypothetical protein